MPVPPPICAKPFNDQSLLDAIESAIEQITCIESEQLE